MSTSEENTKDAESAVATTTETEATAEGLADEEDDLVKLQEEIRKMEEEAARIAKQTEELNSQHKDSASASTGATSSGSAQATGSASTSGAAAGSGTKRDGYSVYVGQVDYSATPEELLAHFEPCGTVERVTIVCDKFTGRPKGFAYLEFQTEEAMENAVKLDGTNFKDRQLKVTHKRVNDPNFFRGGGRGGAPGRGRGGRGFRGGYRGRGRGRGGYRGGGRGGRGGGYHPYY